MITAGAYEDVTIENGTSGLNRNDFIVARYVKDDQTGDVYKRQIFKRPSMMRKYFTIWNLCNMKMRQHLFIMCGSGRWSNDKALQTILCQKDVKK